MSNRVRNWLHDIAVNYRPFVVVLTPMLLLPILLCIRTPAADCAYVVLIMVIFWVSDALPLPVTGLLPVVLFPATGLMGAKAVAKNYITDISLMLLGGIMTALAVEQTQCHRRLALRILLLFGTRPTFILLGMMLPTWFLSMWISNSACAAMMLPIAHAVMEQVAAGTKGQDSIPVNSTNHHNSAFNSLDCHSNGHYGDANSFSNVDDKQEETYFGCDNPVKVNLAEEGDQRAKSNDISKLPADTAIVISNSSEPVDRLPGKGGKVTAGAVEVISEAELQNRLENFGKMLCLAVAYASTIGGTATLTGTPANLVFQKYMNSLYEKFDLPPPVLFSNWLLFGLPHAILCLAFTLLWLQLFYLGWRSFFFCCVKDRTSDNSEGIRRMIRKEYDSLGPIRFAEYAALVLFISLVLLWYIRDPGVFKGYSSLFKKGFVTDSVPAVFIAFLLFVFPAEVPRMFCLRGNDQPWQRFQPLLVWNDVCSRFPWGILIILGGGFALAEGCETSGLSSAIGNQLQSLASLPSWIVVLVVVTIVAILTEVTSNTAVATMVVPILSQMAVNVKINPLYLTLPATMATSYAYMLPVATGVNAVVFSYGNISVLDMAKAGSLLNIICIFIITVGIHTWAGLVFDLDLLPWEKSSLELNGTSLNFGAQKDLH